MTWFDDQLTYSLLSSGRTTGIFQLESEGMRHSQEAAAEQAKTLLRLGPLHGGMDRFHKAPKGEQKFTTNSPAQRYPDETYGIFIYQEQVMVANKTISLWDRQTSSEGDGEKKPEEMGGGRVFVRGRLLTACLKKVRAFEIMEPFAMYGLISPILRLSI